MMDLDTLLMWGLLFGAIGIGYNTYGRRQDKLVPKYCGFAMIFFTYFMPNMYWLLGVGAVLLALPYFLQE